MTQLSAAITIFNSADAVKEEEALIIDSIFDSISSFKQTLYLFSTSLQEVTDTTITKMKEAADAKNMRSEQLKDGLKISILVFALQIPILFGFIILNRTNSCFCLSNLVWFTTGLICAL